jgi:hypothetical protein
MHLPWRTCFWDALMCNPDGTLSWYGGAVICAAVFMITLAVMATYTRDK